MSATLYTFLGRTSELRVAAAANTANLLAAGGEDVALLDLQPRTPPPPVCDHGDAGVATVLAGEQLAQAATTPVESAPTASPDRDDGPVVFGTGGGVELLPLSRSLTPVVVPDDDPADAAARLLDDLAGAFDAVCAVAPPLPDLVGLDRLWVATLNRTAARADGVVGVLDTGDHERDLEQLHDAARGGVRTDCSVAVQPTRDAPPPTVVRDLEYPLRGRVPAAETWPDAAAAAYHEFAARLTERPSVTDLVETPPTLLDPGGSEGRAEQRVVTDGAGADADRHAQETGGDDAGPGALVDDDAHRDGWTLGDPDDDTTEDDDGGRLSGLFR